MFDFNQSSISPAVKSQLDAQFAFFSDLSKTMFEGAQKINALNVQVANTVFEESLSRTRALLSSSNANEALSIASEQAQPVAEKIRAYQQHVQNILAETQASAAQMFESHAPKTTRATEALLKEIAQKTAEQTSKATQRQQEAIDKLTAPIKQNIERATADVIKATH